MIFMEENIVKKVISSKSYNIICASKNNGDRLTNIQEYLKEYFGNNCFLNYRDLYTVLIDTIIEIFDIDQIENLLKYDVKEYYDRKQFMSKSSNTSLDYLDLCNILITKLTLLQMREKVKDHYVELYLIDDSEKLKSYREYDQEVKIKSKK